MSEKHSNKQGKRAFLIFLSIFCVTIFSVSMPMAFKYQEFCRNQERLSRPFQPGNMAMHLAAGHENLDEAEAMKIEKEHPKL